MVHGDSEIEGYRFGSAAYLTDFSDIPEASLEKLRDLDVLFLDALRRKLGEPPIVHTVPRVGYRFGG